MKPFALLAALCCAAVPAYAQESAAAADSVYELADVEAPPRPANVDALRAALQAGYPPAQLAARTEGSVMLEFVVAADGAVRDARVVSSTDAAFDAPTLAAIRVLRFTPAQRGGSPVAARVQIPISWQPPAPQADSAAQGVVSASGRQVNGEPVYSMTPVVAEVPVYELSAVEELPQVRNAGALRREMNRLYPAELRSQGIRGQVDVRFRVDAEGVPGTFRVIRSTDPRFNDVSVEALPVLRFRPAKVDGRAVPVWVELPLIWEP